MLLLCRTCAFTVCHVNFYSRQAAERFNSIDSTTFRPLFLVGDCFSVRLAEFYPAETEFDIVSCQFAMHYAFETETRVRQMLLNVTERLRPGGFFIGTTPDANVLVRKLRAIDGLTIGNGVFKIDFDSRFSSKVFPITGGSYGIRYNFSLDSNVEDCPEYLVHFPSFQELAKEYQLELILYCNFHEFYNEFTSGEYKDFRDLFQRMGVLDEQGTISPDEWDAIYLYVAFAFKKVGPVNQGLGVDSVKAKKWPSIADDDVVYMTQPSDTDVFSSNMGTLAKAASVNGRSGHLASENGTPSYH